MAERQLYDLYKHVSSLTQEQIEPFLELIDDNTIHILANYTQHRVILKALELLYIQEQ